MAKKTDGHIQFSGSGYQFYLTKQANLRCETEDCSTCKEASKAFDKRVADGNDKAAGAAKAAEGKRVEAAAAQSQKAGEDKALRDAAALLNLALNAAAIAKRKEDNEAEQGAADAIAKARASCKKAEELTARVLEEGKARALATYLAAVEKAKATDWLAKVSK